MKSSYKLALTLSAGVCVLAVIYYATNGGQTASPIRVEEPQDKSTSTGLHSDLSGSGPQASVSGETQPPKRLGQTNDNRAADVRARVEAAMAGQTSTDTTTTNQDPAKTQGPATGIALVRTDSPASPTIRPNVPWPGPGLSNTAKPKPAADLYTVLADDTLSSIAIKYYNDKLRWMDIAQANPTVDPTRLKIGQVLRIPDKRSLRTSSEPVPPGPDGVKTYKIRPGDSLSTVAETFYGDPTLWRTIYNFNRKTIGSNPNAIQAGMTLKVPPRVQGAR